MPFVNINGQLIEVTQEQLDNYTAGNQTEVAAGGDIVNVVPVESGQIPEQILTPNTASTSPDQTLTETFQPYSTLAGVPPGADPEVTEPEEGLVRLNDGANLGVPDEDGFVETSTGLNVLPEDIPIEEPENQSTPLNLGETLNVDEFGFTQSNTGLNILPEDQEPGEPEGYLREFSADGDRLLNPEQVSAAQEQASVTQGFLEQARQQQTISNQRKQVNNGDWRVRLRLAPMAKYLYNAPSPGILQPLKISDGVIFPYTPSIDTVYKAEYDAYSLTHSNYKGYFYKNSSVDAINLKCTFTAQSTAEANYLLAVITFFKSVTKMFYGQDAERGAPPPLTYLSGLGEYQFNEHPCLVSQFNYNLPADVDYIRANSALNVGLNQITQRDRQTVTTASNFGGLNRLAAAALSKGAIPSPLPPPTLGLNSPTYVPTKIDITIVLLPVQSRSQVSKQFSLKSFANGDLIKGGFW
jgi:hypothetical protein